MIDLEADRTKYPNGGPDSDHNLNTIARKWFSGGPTRDYKGTLVGTLV